MFNKKPVPFTDDVLKKSKQGFTASAAFLAVGGMAAAALFTIRGPVQHEDQLLWCPEGHACVIERDPEYHHLGGQWYADSEQCPQGKVAIVPIDEPQHCDSQVQGGSVPADLLRECWRCVQR